MSSKNDSDYTETPAPMLEQSDIGELLLAEEAPCVTIYVATEPISNYSEQNRISYKDQIKKVGNALDERDMDKYLRADLIDRLQAVGTTDTFWMHQQHGLAVFASPERFEVRRMMRSPTTLGIVADSFHLRPALHATQSWMRYQVLCLAVQGVALYDCDQGNIAEVELHKDVPREMSDIVGDTDAPWTPEGPDRDANENSELKRYFEAVDGTISDHHNGRTNLPLLLASVSEHQGVFRQVSRNDNLLPEGLNRNPFHEIEERRLGKVSWEVARDQLATNLDAWVEHYREQAAHDHGESDLEKVAYSATIAQIQTLLVDDTVRVEGSVDGDSGTVSYGAPGDANSDDVIDDIVEYVLCYDGELQFLPGERMPTDTGVAAVLRFPLAPSS